MYRLLLTKYAPRLAKTKKQASYMTQEQKVEQELPLHEAISLKCDPKKMDDAYNPIAVERYWDAWWSEKYFSIELVSSSTPIIRPTTRKSSPYACRRPTSLATCTSAMP